MHEWCKGFTSAELKKRDLVHMDAGARKDNLEYELETTTILQDSNMEAANLETDSVSAKLGILLSQIFGLCK